MHQQDRKWVGATWGENIDANWLFGISPEGIGVIGMCLNFMVALTVSRFTPAPPETVQRIVEQIRVPRHIGETHL